MSFLKRRAIKSRDKIKIITLVRDPYSRNVSMFFQDIAHWIYNYIGQDNHDIRDDNDNFLFDVYLDSFDHEYTDSWFDKEILRFTGIDVFSDKMPENGAKIYRKDKVELLVLKAEQLNQNIEIIKEFVGVDFELKNSNVGDKKWYSSLYKEFKENANVNLSEYKRKIKDSKIHKHFYK